MDSGQLLTHERGQLWLSAKGKGAARGRPLSHAGCGSALLRTVAVAIGFAARFSARLAVLAVGGVLGGIAGWYRGKTVTIEKEPNGVLMAQASPLGLILLVALFAGRSLLRDLIEGHAAQWHLNAMAVTDAFLVFAMALIVMQRVEMYIRARRVQAGRLDDHVEVVA